LQSRSTKTRVNSATMPGWSGPDAATMTCGTSGA
jgi:hypothetical protein